MTPLRRNWPLFAPRVSSRAVGRTRPIPNRPLVARSRYGSTFQTILAERNLPIRVFENQAKPRLKEEGGRLGSTYLSAVGIAGFLPESGSVDREIVDRAQFPRGSKGATTAPHRPESTQVVFCSTCQSSMGPRPLSVTSPRLSVSISESLTRRSRVEASTLTTPRSAIWAIRLARFTVCPK